MLVTDFPSSTEDDNSPVLSNVMWAESCRNTKGCEWSACLPKWRLNRIHSNLSSSLFSVSHRMNSSSPFCFDLHPLTAKDPFFLPQRWNHLTKRLHQNSVFPQQQKRHLYASLHQERKGKSSIRLDTGVVNWLLSQLSNRLSTWSSQPLLWKEDHLTSGW